MSGPSTDFITTSTSEIRLGADGIVRVLPTARYAIGLEEAEEVVRAFTALGRGRRVPILVDIRESVPPSQAARAHYMGPEARRACSAVGLVVSSPVSRVLGNFMLKLARDTIPARLFTSSEEAIAWLKGYLQ